MAETGTLLVELLTEELPPRALKRLGEVFADLIASGLRSRNFIASNSKVISFATPRRLAVTISNVLAVAPDAEVTDKLMPAKVARDSAGGVSEALKKKLGALGRAHMATSTLDAMHGPDRVFVQSDGKADYVYLRRLAKGQSLPRGLEEALGEAIAKLPFPKVMSYARRGSYYNDVKFVRPAHRLLALHEADPVAVSALGLASGRTTDGHRFLSRKDITIATAEAYEPTLEAEGKVVANFGKRRALIAAELQIAALGAMVIMPDELLDEVTALVEWPKVYTGGFDQSFLAVPQECLILTMQKNQRYFALADADGKLQNRFLLVSNLTVHDPSAIVRGNERVLRARLADAKFFYDQDRRQTLASRVPKLANVVYHNKLGSQLDRVERLRKLAGAIATRIGADPLQAERAAYLAKADLLTDMVGEFPELQGLMGRYYATHDGEPEAVAAALEQHYWPRFSGDALPDGLVAKALALADKMDTLVGIWGAGSQPTGDKDPFGLRRAALGVIRILDDDALPLDLPWLCEESQKQFRSGLIADGAWIDVQKFIVDRLKGHLRETGASAQEVEAVLAQREGAREFRLDAVRRMLEAVVEFNRHADVRELAEMNKRVRNIISKNDELSDSAHANFREALLVAPAEKALYRQMLAIEKELDRSWAEQNYGAYLQALLPLKASLAMFFDKGTGVMVMDPDPTVRANRAGLLQKLGIMVNKVADISKLAI